MTLTKNLRHIFWYKWRLISIWNLNTLIPQHTILLVLAFTRRACWYYRVLLDSLLFGMLSDAHFAKVTYTFWIVDAYFDADPRYRRACYRLTLLQTYSSRQTTGSSARKVANLSTEETYSGAILRSYKPTVPLSSLLEQPVVLYLSGQCQHFAGLSQESLHTIDSCIPP